MKKITSSSDTNINNNDNSNPSVNILTNSLSTSVSHNNMTNLYIKNNVENGHIILQTTINNDGTNDTIAKNRLEINGDGNTYLYNNFGLNTFKFLNDGSAYKLSSGTSWVSFSDKRIKENITPINTQECLETINKLKVRNYHFKKFWIKQTNQKIKKTYCGLIAQELEEIDKDLVHIYPYKYQKKKLVEKVDTNGNIYKEQVDDGEPFEIPDLKSIDISELQMKVFGAIQELSKRNQELDKKNKKLEEKYDHYIIELKKEIRELKKEIRNNNHNNSNKLDVNMILENENKLQKAILSIQKRLKKFEK